MSTCKICGTDNCKQHTFIFNSRLSKTVSGSTPPEVFVGKWNYPNVYAGVLTPPSYGSTERYTSPEVWHAQNFSIDKIRDLRSEMVYGKTQTHVARQSSKVLEVTKEVAMSHKPIATEMTLKRPVSHEEHREPAVALMNKTAQVEKIRLEENPQVDKKVDYLVQDTHAKASNAIQELYKANTQTTTIMKLLSVGLLGQADKRKLVPTRWSITAVDDTLSKSLLEKIRQYKELQHIELFTSEYLGNHYEILLLPGTWSFEIIEVSHKGGVWQDYETNSPRKGYAESVAGGYYAVRLAVTEYLARIQRQATIIVFREVRPEYNTPCGVGILRECSRSAFQHTPTRPSNLASAQTEIQSRLQQPLSVWLSKSELLKVYGKQKKLTQFI